MKTIFVLSVEIRVGMLCQKSS